MGVQSQAAIHITVRVMPTFRINGSNAAPTVGRIGNAHALDFSSNMTGLRFDVIAVSGAPGKANTPVAELTIAGRDAPFHHSNARSLFLIVPD